MTLRFPVNTSTAGNTSTTGSTDAAGTRVDAAGNTDATGAMKQPGLLSNLQYHKRCIVVLIGKPCKAAGIP